jgi:hypothetical protein
MVHRDYLCRGDGGELVVRYWLIVIAGVALALFRWSRLKRGRSGLSRGWPVVEDPNWPGAGKGK